MSEINRKFYEYAKRFEQLGKEYDSLDLLSQDQAVDVLRRGAALANEFADWIASLTKEEWEGIDA